MVDCDYLVLVFVYFLHQQSQLVSPSGLYMWMSVGNVCEWYGEGMVANIFPFYFCYLCFNNCNLVMYPSLHYISLCQFILFLLPCSDKPFIHLAVPRDSNYCLSKNFLSKILQVTKREKFLSFEIILPCVAHCVKPAQEIFSPKEWHQRETLPCMSTKSSTAS